jgi:uncharacterized membrane protein
MNVFSPPVLVSLCLLSLLGMIYLQKKGRYTRNTRMLMEVFFFAAISTGVLTLIIIFSRLVF